MGDTKVKLILQADNSDLIKGVKEAQNATQKLHDTSVKGVKKEVDILQALENSLKNIKARKDAAFDPREIEKWDKKLLQAKKDLEDYNATNKKTEDQAKKTGEETAKSTDKAKESSGSLLSSLKNLVIGYFSVTTALRVFNTIIESTQVTAEKFKITVSGWRGAFESIATSIATMDFKNFGQKIKDAIAEGERYAKGKIEVDDKMRALEIIQAEKFNELLIKRNELNTAKTKDARIKAGLEVVKIEEDLQKGLQEIRDLAYQNESKNLQQKTKLTEKELLGYIKQEPVIKANIEAGKKYNDMIAERNQIELAMQSTQGRVGKILTREEKGRYDFIVQSIKNATEETKRFAFAQENMKGDEKLDLLAEAYKGTKLAQGEALSNLIRVNSRIASEQEQSDREGLTKGKEVADKKLKITEEYNQLSQKLIDDYDKSNIESLEGVEKLKAQRDYGLKQLAEFRTQLAKLGAMTPELEAVFAGLGENFEKVFIKGVNDIKKAEEEKEWQFGLDLGKKLFDQTNKEAKDAWDKMLEREKKQIEDEKILAEQKKEAFKSIGESVFDYMSILEELSQKQVEIAQRDRELLDTKVDETQSALEIEIELYKAGYASNVGAKKKELADLKKQRDLALIEEEKARKKEHAMQLASLVAQKLVDIAQIISSTAVANAKAVAASPLTFGQPWVGINTIAAALSIASAIAAIIAASTAKFAKGGWTGEGKERDSSGERVAGIVHEKEFVIKKGPALRFREVLEAINRDDKKMIFNSFNKLNPELYKGTTVNNVVVENEGPNKRLDQVNNQLKQLNKKGKEESVIELSNKTIYRKGNLTRTVRR